MYVQAVMCCTGGSGSGPDISPASSCTLSGTVASGRRSEINGCQVKSTLMQVDHRRLRNFVLAGNEVHWVDALWQQRFEALLRSRRPTRSLQQTAYYQTTRNHPNARPYRTHRSEHALSIHPKPPNRVAIQARVNSCHAKSTLMQVDHRRLRFSCSHAMK